MWGLDVDYSSNAMRCTWTMWQPYFLEAYDSIVKCRFQCIYCQTCHGWIHAWMTIMTGMTMDACQWINLVLFGSRQNVGHEPMQS